MTTSQVEMYYAISCLKLVHMYLKYTNGLWYKWSGKTPQTIPTCLSEMIRLNHICLAKAA